MLLGWYACAFALDPSLEVSQYAHTAWKVRDGFSTGTIFAIAQTPDGYLWLGSEFGLFRFDGIRSVQWQPPAGQRLPAAPYSLLVTRDGTLWIGTFAGLVSWNGSKLAHYPDIGEQFVTSLLEDREGTVWAGILGTPTGRLCAIRDGRAQCYGHDGAFGTFVWSLCEDSTGTLWVGAESGVWRWKPGPTKRYPMPGMRVGDLATADDGRLVIGVSHAGLKQLVADKLEAYPIPSATRPNSLLPDRNVDSNKLLRDRDGGLWIGTHARGLIHVHHGRTDVFAKADGLAGDITSSLFEDHEGNVWVATTGGLERFRELPITTVSAQQGLPSDFTSSVLAATDGSIWVATDNGLAQWKNGKFGVYRKASGLPDDAPQSLFQDYRGRIWVSTTHGLAYFSDGRFTAINSVPSTEVYSMTGDTSGNLWLSGNRGLSHLLDGRLVEQFPWSALGRRQQAKVVVFDAEQGGVWLAFWMDGGVSYFKDGQVRAAYTVADGLGHGPVASVQLDRDEAVWAATEEGGLSRIKSGRIATLTTKNGLPCNALHWSIEDDDRSLWLYTACGLLRITRDELEAWIADPQHSVHTTVWDAADGLKLRAVSPGYYNPAVAKTIDDKLWFLSGEGVHIVDPHHLPMNKVPPPVRIERIVGDQKTYWQNLPETAVANLRLAPRIRDLEIDYTALSLVAPEKMQFRIKLEGQDMEWRVPVNPRHSHYTNLSPGRYTFRVVACNNSGVWNEQGALLRFVIPPAWFQTNWFRALCAVTFLLLLWMAYQLRVRQLAAQFNMRLEERVGERTRIARELHDTLLQSFHGLLVRFQSVLQLLPERPLDAKQRLESTIDEAAEAITEARDAVQGLRSSTVIANELALTLKTLGEELAMNPINSGTPHFQVEVFGASRELHPIVRDEVYRLAAEALRNAFLHAHARHIEVELRYNPGELVVVVRDDGKGMDPQVLADKVKAGHYGLRGMQERAKLLRGKLDLWSELNAGTQIELTVPGANAYAKMLQPRWQLMRFSRLGKEKKIKIES